MIRLIAMSAFAFAVAMVPAFGKVSSAELGAISIPDKVETAISTLEFFDEVPTDATVATVYDNLDRMRGMQVFLDNVGVSQVFKIGDQAMSFQVSGKWFAVAPEGRPDWGIRTTLTLLFPK